MNKQVPVQLCVTKSLILSQTVNVMYVRENKIKNNKKYGE